MFAEIASIAGPVIGGLIGAEGAEDAANAQGQATAGAIAEQRRQFDTSRRDLAPYRNLGNAASLRVGQLLGLRVPGAQYEQFLPDGRSVREAAIEDVNAGVARMNAERGVRQGDPMWSANFEEYDEKGQEALLRQFGNPLLAQHGLSSTPAAPNPADIMAMDPGYQFRLNEGQQGIDRRIGAMGLRNSGAALKAAQRFGQDYASNEYGNVFNRLSGAAGTGQAATNAGAQLGAQNAQTVGGMMTGLGNARGAAAIGGANAIGGALNTVGNYFGQQQTLDKMIEASKSRVPGWSTPGYFGTTYGGT